jgi:hypothetical protein
MVVYAASKTPSSSFCSRFREKTRQSKLAKENNISAEEEAEIKEAYHLFPYHMKIMKTRRRV